jgi:hypothetical protein
MVELTPGTPSNISTPPFTDSLALFSKLSKISVTTHTREGCDDPILSHA